MSFLQTLVVFSLEGGRYALSLPAVQGAARAVELTPLPKAPAIVLGVINVRGQIVPVLNIRRRFGLPQREIALSDHFLLARTSRQPVALAVDNVTGVLTRPIETIIAAEKVLPEMEYVRGVVKLEDGLIFIHDLDTFLSLEEESALEEALPNSHQKGAPAID